MAPGELRSHRRIPSKRIKTHASVPIDMADKRITFFECHTHGDVQFGPKTIAGGDISDDPESSSPAPEDEDDGGSRSTILGVLVVVAVLAAIAVAVKKVRSGDDQDTPVDATESDHL